ncbi:MAG: hypothetical protein V1748_01415 [Actinomycetota bacterium]
MGRYALKLTALAVLVAILALAGCGGSTTGKSTTPRGFNLSIPTISAPVVQQTVPPAPAPTPGEPEPEPEPEPDTPAQTQPTTPTTPNTPTTPTSPTCPT